MKTAKFSFILAALLPFTQSLTTYDVIVVGGGSAGLTAAKLAADTLGKSVVIVEGERMGGDCTWMGHTQSMYNLLRGDCTWTGCVPSKSLLAAAKSVHNARKFGALEGAVDYAKIRKKISDSIQEIYDEDDSPEALQKLGIEVVSGSAMLTSQSTVNVKLVDNPDSCLQLTAKEGIILCTGASPSKPSDIEGIDQVDYLTTETIWGLETLPDRLTIIGGGPVGCEMAQAFSRLGSKVTIIATQLLPLEDPAAGAVLEKVFAAEGITLVRGRASKVSSDGKTRIVTVSDADEIVAGDKLLVALGRTPRTHGMGLVEVGIDLTPQGGIKVDDKLRTSVKGVYAAGDCTGDRQFTHYAGYQGAIAARNIILPLTDSGVLDTVPATTFTSPEVASVGLTEASAIEKYGKDRVTVSHQLMAHVDRAICEGETDGFLKIVHLKKNGKILGAILVAPAAGEMLSEISVAMAAGLSFDKLAKVMHAYPAYSMALQLMAADMYYEKTMRLKPVYNVLKKLGL